MERFNSIYPFTTENIAGYMNNLDLTNKKVITVTGSGDHIINAILKGTKDITTFDINPLTKYYLDLKLSAIEYLSIEEFLKVFLYDNDLSLAYEIIRYLDLPEECKTFWLNQYSKNNNSGILLKHSSLFNTKYFNPDSKLWQNLYLTLENYNQVKSIMRDCNIKFINTNLQDLELRENYDYMFLSNISDYLNMMYQNNPLLNYQKLIENYQKHVENIYFAYLYDIGNNNPRSEIDDLTRVKRIFKDFEIQTFKSALEIKEEKKDGVLILRRN